MSPNAVALRAVEMPAAMKAERCDGSAAPTAENATIRPEMVPSSPSRVATLASTLRWLRRRDSGARARTAASSPADCTVAASSPATWRMPSATRAAGALDIRLQLRAPARSPCRTRARMSSISLRLLRPPARLMTMKRSAEMASTTTAIPSMKYMTMPPSLKKAKNM